uniref:Uncharacterized protein n=1 Tax=Nelumbo nucifera TaxID=4432 RepID=A0A822Z467_NELNU|nr:TPA_asm: hypothetical protein HUJ06_008926 [Nelumbo nucifera]
MKICISNDLIVYCGFVQAQNIVVMNGIFIYISHIHNSKDAVVRNGFLVLVVYCWAPMHIKEPS